MIWGDGFRDPGPSNGELAPPRTVCSPAGGACWTGSPPPADGVRGVTPGKFFEIFDTKSRVRGQFGPENKLIEGQPNAYDVICRNASVLTFHLWPTIFAGASFRLQNICRNGGSTAFPHHYTPAFYPHQGGSEYRPKNDSGCKTLQCLQKIEICFWLHLPTDGKHASN